MLSVIALSVLVGLSPHGHSAVGTADKSFEEILPGWTGVQGLRPATVTFQRCLDQVKEFLADRGSWVPGSNSPRYFTLPA